MNTQLRPQDVHRLTIGSTTLSSTTGMSDAFGDFLVGVARIRGRTLADVEGANASTVGFEGVFCEEPFCDGCDLSGE